MSSSELYGDLEGKRRYSVDGIHSIPLVSARNESTQTYRINWPLAEIGRRAVRESGIGEDAQHSVEQQSFDT